MGLLLLGLWGESGGLEESAQVADHLDVRRIARAGRWRDDDLVDQGAGCLAGLGVLGVGQGGRQVVDGGLVDAGEVRRDPGHRERRRGELPGEGGAALLEAGQVVLPRAGEAAATQAAHLAGEQMARPAALPEAGTGRGRGGGRGVDGGFASETVLGDLPEGWVDDREVGDGMGDQFGFGVGLAHAAAGERLLGVTAAVPDQPAGIEGIAQQAIIAARPAADGRIIPDRPAGAGDALRVERLSDVARRAAGQELGEDAAHDGGHQRLVGGALDDRARDGVVGEFLDDGPALALGAGAADAKLIFDRGMALDIGTEAGVDHRAGHGGSLPGG